MPEPREAKITRLLKRGLNHYGLGDLEAAIASWEEVLKLDPGNRAALDYLEAAREESGARPSRPARPKPGPATPVEDDDATPRTLDAMLQAAARGQPAGSVDSAVETALAAYKDGDLERAYSMLVAVAKAHPDRLDVEGYVSMLRAKRAKSFSKVIGDQGRVLRVAKPMSELTKLDLKPDEGFLLSQIDGVLTIEQVLSLQADRVRGLEIIARLLEDGIIG